MILDKNPIPVLVGHYRELKVQSDALKAQMDGLKAEIEPLITESGNWKDKNGYAEFREIKPYMSFKSDVVSDLAETWAESTNAVMQSCGKMLLRMRKRSPDRTSLYIK